MKKLSLLFFTVMLGMGAFAQTTYSWSSGATNGNWNTVGNWWNGTSFTAIPGGGDILIFDNDVQTTMTHDLTSNTRHQIFFTSNATQSRIITGTTENIFYNNGTNNSKIENNSSANQTINFPLKWGSNPMELNPVSGDLTITKAINNNNLWTDVWGGNGKTLSIASMSGKGGLTIKNNNNNSTIVKITGTSSYTGNTYVDFGTLELQADVSSAEIIVRNGAKLVINGTDIDIQKLTIESGGTVEVLPGKSLTVNGTAVNNGTIKLLSNGTDGTATLVGNVGGNAEVQQYLASQRNWYMSSPVFEPTRPSTADYPNVESYDETLSSNNWIDLGASAKLLTAKGYVVYPATTGEKTITFTGTLNTGDKTIGLTRTAANTTYQGFNLVGNPYPSFLDAAKLVSVNSENIDQTVWYRTANWSTDKYVYEFQTYNAPSGLSVPVATNGQYIPPMQSVWVRAKQAANLQFTDVMCLHKPDGLTIPFRAPQAVANQILRLQLTNGTATDETVLYFNANAANGYDAYDSPKMLNNGTTVPNLYTTVGTERLVINGMSAIPYNVELPLSLQGAAGNYTITASEFSNFAEGDKVQLIDNGIPTDLTPGSSYTFSIAAGENTTGRFSVVFPKSGVPTGVDNAGAGDVTVFTRSSRIVVTANEAAQGSMIYVFNGVGQRLAAQAVRGTVNEIGRTFPAGVYVVKVNNTTAKVVVK